MRMVIPKNPPTTPPTRVPTPGLCGVGGVGGVGVEDEDCAGAPVSDDDGQGPLVL